MRIRNQAPDDKGLSPGRALSLVLLLWLALAAAAGPAAAAEPAPAAGPAAAATADEDGAPDAAAMHGIAMHGPPALPPGFAHLPYADPAAPTGGRVVFGETGAFDSLNPFILKGQAPWGIRAHVVESLLGRSWDEPFTLYGLLAEWVATPPDRSFVEFALRPEARFSDGSPVTVEDVVFSMELLAREGRPLFRGAWAKVSGWRQTGPRSVRFDFQAPDRELPLILGLRPILKAVDWRDRAFAETTLVPFTGSGPYVIGEFEPGRFVSFRRNPDYWGRDLGLNRGQHRFDEIRYDYFRDQDALFQAVATGAVTLFNDQDPVRWAERYDLPAVEDGRLARLEIPHARPTGMRGFVFNTRRAPFDDIRVREALALAFDWPWVNDRLFRGQYRRIESYFGNSPLAHRGAAQGREAEILAPFAAALPPGALEAPRRLPETDGSGRDREALLRAAALLDAAGWPVRDGARRRADGRTLSFEVLVQASGDETMANLWRDGLRRLGVEAVVRLVDAAQFEARRTEYDYDVTVHAWVMSLSPGNEQRLYFGAGGRSQPGTRNYMGVAEPAIDAAIDAILAAETPEDFTAAVRALDRVLTAGLYVVPFGYLPTDRIAFARGLAAPARPALYGWRPEVWWHAPGAGPPPG